MGKSRSLLQQGGSSTDGHPLADWELGGLLLVFWMSISILEVHLKTWMHHITSLTVMLSGLQQLWDQIAPALLQQIHLQGHLRVLMHPLLMGGIHHLVQVQTSLRDQFLVEQETPASSRNSASHGNLLALPGLQTHSKSKTETPKAQSQARVPFAVGILGLLGNVVQLDLEVSFSSSMIFICTSIVSDVMELWRLSLHLKFVFQLLLIQMRFVQGGLQTQHLGQPLIVNDQVPSCSCDCCCCVFVFIVISSREEEASRRGHGDNDRMSVINRKGMSTATWSSGSN
ncbi:hypothetical protein EYF80_025882 [Liparis tanakae]|uniref:Uncharacterized protein n=1 Tax=Liparis tanakae TaxID=230148 RepID=A0A4Z2HDD2_9TELE|nr:hypothetical protein EYF80_025882 [Liparis tanakae]